MEPGWNRGVSRLNFRGAVSYPDPPQFKLISVSRADPKYGRICFIYRIKTSVPSCFDNNWSMHADAACSLFLFPHRGYDRRIFEKAGLQSCCLSTLLATVLFVWIWLSFLSACTADILNKVACDDQRGKLERARGPPPELSEPKEGHNTSHGQLAWPASGAKNSHPPASFTTIVSASSSSPAGQSIVRSPEYFVFVCFSLSKTEFTNQSAARQKSFTWLKKQLFLPKILSNFRKFLNSNLGRTSVPNLKNYCY